jgi:hypothetical protein
VSEARWAGRLSDQELLPGYRFWSKAGSVTLSEPATVPSFRLRASPVSPGRLGGRRRQNEFLTGDLAAPAGRAEPLAQVIEAGLGMSMKTGSRLAAVGQVDRGAPVSVQDKCPRVCWPCGAPHDPGLAAQIQLRPAGGCQQIQPTPNVGRTAATRWLSGPLLLAADLAEPAQRLPLKMPVGNLLRARHRHCQKLVCALELILAHA